MKMKISLKLHDVLSIGLLCFHQIVVSSALPENFKQISVLRSNRIAPETEETGQDREDQEETVQNETSQEIFDAEYLESRIQQLQDQYDVLKNEFDQVVQVEEAFEEQKLAKQKRHYERNSKREIARELKQKEALETLEKELELAIKQKKERRHCIIS